MGDQLEKYVMNHRDQFDSEVPSPEVWQRIEKRMPKKTSYKWVWQVAAVLFLVSTVLLLTDRMRDPVDASFNQEFAQAEDYYITLINHRKNEITQHLASHESQAFLEEIEALDLMYQELKKTYQTHASDERVLGAMISNLQLRLEILNRQIEILQKIKDYEEDTTIQI